jgi:hypothetical protein
MKTESNWLLNGLIILFLYLILQELISRREGTPVLSGQAQGLFSGGILSFLNRGIAGVIDTSENIIVALISRISNGIGVLSDTILNLVLTFFSIIRRLLVRG